MQHGDVTEGAFTLLHGDQIRFFPFERVGDRFVRMILFFQEDATEHLVPYSVREQKPLVVLDGEVPENAFPRQTRQALAHDLGPMPTDESQQRKQKEHELALPVPERLTRRFLIVPSGTGICVRYHKENTANRFTILEVSCVKKEWWRIISRTAS